LGFLAASPFAVRYPLSFATRSFIAFSPHFTQVVDLSVFHPNAPRNPLIQCFFTPKFMTKQRSAPCSASVHERSTFPKSADKSAATRS
jgi:hypothetical protein